MVGRVLFDIFPHVGLAPTNSLSPGLSLACLTQDIMSNPWVCLQNCNLSTTDWTKNTRCWWMKRKWLPISFLHLRTVCLGVSHILSQRSYRQNIHRAEWNSSPSLRSARGRIVQKSICGVYQNEYFSNRKFLCKIQRNVSFPLILETPLIYSINSIMQW